MNDEELKEKIEIFEKELKAMIMYGLNKKQVKSGGFYTTSDLYTREDIYRKLSILKAELIGFEGGRQQTLKDELEFLIELEIKVKYFVENKTIKKTEHHTLRDINIEELNPNWLEVLSIVQCRIKQIEKQLGVDKNE